MSIARRCNPLASLGRKKPVAVHKEKMISRIVLDPCILVPCVQDQHEEPMALKAVLKNK